VAASVAIGLSAVVFALRGGELVVLTVKPAPGGPAALPSGSFDPAGHRTFELALRAFVTEQTGFQIGYVEQLYTFGDEGRDAPLADLGGAASPYRVVSVGYLALTPEAVDTSETVWTPWSHFFPWEDWRKGRPPALTRLEESLRAWAARPGGAVSADRLARARHLFALDGAPWNEERVLERYELIYEAGLAPEAARDRARTSLTAAHDPQTTPEAAGAPMLSDHRRILATGLGRLRGKLKYRPVVFELTPPRFTLLSLQRALEAIAGVPLHKQNFRRALERTELVEGLGVLDGGAGGRPAELFRFRREALAERPASGIALPLLREG
jgi:hypothetical protein